MFAGTLFPVSIAAIGMRGTGMKYFKTILSTGVGVFLTATSLQAAGLCSCCETGVAASCKIACAPVKVEAKQCVAVVDFKGKSGIGANANPLYGVSLANIHLEDAGRGELEDFRKLLEAMRKGVEKDRKASLRDFSRRRIDEATAAARAKLYEVAIVNYYLGLQAYRGRVKTAPAK
jgi:hypothetical protein